MNIVKNIFLLLFFFLVIGFQRLFCMESGGNSPAIIGLTQQLHSPEKDKKSLSSPAKPTFFFTNPENDGGMKQVLNSMKKADEIYVNSFYFSDRAVLNALQQRKDAGAQVYINIRHSPFIAAMRKHFDIHQSDKIHNKDIVWKFTNSETGTEEYRIWEGSRNLTNMAHAADKKPTNMESTLYRQLSKEEYAAAINHFNAIRNQNTATTPTKKIKATLQETPQKTATIYTYGSTPHDIPASIAQRIKNATEQHSLTISAYTLNNPAFIDACKEAAQKGTLSRFFIDGKALNTQKEFLKELQENGTQVFVFNPSQDKRCGRCPIQKHDKMIMRIKDNKTLIGLGSANFTEQSNNDFNSFTLYPTDDQDTIEEVENGFDTIEKNSVPLTEALKMWQQLQDKKLQQQTNNTKSQKTKNNINVLEKRPTARRKIDLTKL